MQDFIINALFSLLGITNGIDVSEWDPSSDEHIDFHYSVDDLSGKVINSLSPIIMCFEALFHCTDLLQNCNCRLSVKLLCRKN